MFLYRGSFLQNPITSSSVHSIPGFSSITANDEKATKEVLSQDGWLFTGDMAMEDEDGFIFLVDRKKDVIISGGENTGSHPQS